MLSSRFDLEMKCDVVNPQPDDPRLGDLVADVEPFGEEFVMPVTWNVADRPFRITITNRNSDVIHLIGQVGDPHGDEWHGTTPSS
jgi:hypothetical protein